MTLLLPRTFTEPAAPKSETDSGVAVRAGAERRGHVLLVEDDPEVAALTRELLSSLGFSVIHVSSPDAALGALANSRAVDVVVTDIMMPGGVSGLQLAREIRRRHSSVPVLLTTGYVESASDMRDNEFPLLLKPYSIDALADALKVDVR